MKEKIRKKKKEEKADNTHKLQDALIKKALGYDATEVVEEYVSEEGEIRLLKKKITTKNVPPDMTAIKLLLVEEDKPIEEYTDEELETEKLRLIKILNEAETGDEKD